MSTTQHTTTRSGGIGFSGLLTILLIGLIGLKLTGYIDWSWWWVLSPMWISFVMIFIVIFVIFLAAMFWETYDERTRRV